MGTRALTRVNISTGGKIINLYRQHDGYPSCHGKELFDFLNGFEIVNGISDNEGPKAANGAGCLAAQLVAHFKNRKNEIADVKAELRAALKKDGQDLRKAIQFIAEYTAPSAKTIGGFYLYPVDSTDMGQDYEYIVTVTEKSWDSDAPAAIKVEVIGYKGSMFTGTVEEFGAFCTKPEVDEEE